MKTWYPKTTNTGSPHEQGLIIDEATGDNIAVVYDPKNTALLAAAPKLLSALESSIATLERCLGRLCDMDRDGLDDDEIDLLDEEIQSLRQAITIG